MSHCSAQGCLYLFKQLFIGIIFYVFKADIFACFQKCNVSFGQILVRQRTFRSADNISVSLFFPQESRTA